MSELFLVIRDWLDNNYDSFFDAFEYSQLT